MVPRRHLEAPEESISANHLPHLFSWSATPCFLKFDVEVSINRGYQATPATKDDGAKQEKAGNP